MTNCNCLDWNANFKVRQLETMDEFNRKLHTIGVTEEEENNYYYTRPEQIAEVDRRAKQAINYMRSK